MVPPSALCRLPAPVLSGSGLPPMGVRGGREHQVRLRRRRGELVLERQREGRTGPPRPLQVKAPLLARRARHRSFSPSGLRRAFRPVASALTLLPPGHPHPPSPRIFPSWPSPPRRAPRLLPPSSACTSLPFGGRQLPEAPPLCCMGLPGTNPGSVSR